MDVLGAASDPPLPLTPRAGSRVRCGYSRGARGTPGLALWATGLCGVLLSWCEGPGALKLGAGAQLSRKWVGGTYPVGLKQCSARILRENSQILRNKNLTTK